MFQRLFSFLFNIYDYLFVPNRWYIIEGNIGCGKTTLLSLLEKENDVEVIKEPVDLWKQIQQEDGQNILGLFYSNPSRYAYLFQTIVFKTRMMALEPIQRCRIRFSERSIWTDKNIFSTTCHEMGHMSTIEKNTYDVWFSWLEKKVTRKPDGIIYLHATPEVCLDRVHTRDRSEESSVSIDYLTMIHKKHEEWLRRPSYQGIPIYLFDNKQHSETTLKQVRHIISLP